MEPEQLFTGSKWELLMEIAKRPRSTSELAELLETSQANVSQQLRQLELSGIVERRRTRRRGIHYVYEIAKDHLYIVHLTPTSANKRNLRQNPYERFLAGLLLHRHGLSLLGLVVGKPQVFSKLGAVGVLERDHPELFALTDNIEEIRQHHANVTVPTIDGDRRVAVWSHTKQEVEEGLERKEPYFLTALEDVSITYDPDGTLKRLKQQLEEQQ